MSRHAHLARHAHRSVGALHKELHREHQSHILVAWFKKLHDPAVWPEWSRHPSAQKWRKPSSRSKHTSKAIERMRYMAQRSPGSKVRGLSGSLRASPDLPAISDGYTGSSSLDPDTGPIISPATRAARIKAAIDDYPEVAAWRKVRSQLSGSQHEVDAFFAGYCREDEEACLANWEQRPSLALLPVVTAQMTGRDATTAVMRLDGDNLRTLQVQLQIRRTIRLLKKMKHLARVEANEA